MIANMNRLFQTLIFCLLSGLSPLSAFTYYVSNAGSNANSGLSPAQAFLTIQKGADVAVAGDTVLVANGTYAGFDFRNKNGTAANPVVFKALGPLVLINSSGPIRSDGINIENADFVVVDGFTVNNMPGTGNGVRVVTSDFCVVRNCHCDNNAKRGIFTGFTNDILIENNVCTNSVSEHGIYVSNSSDRPVIRFNTCHGNNNIGIHMNGDLSAGGDGIISDAQVYGNILYDNGAAAGINLDGVEDPLVFNNLIFNNHIGQGIALFQQDGAIPTRGARIFNNTIIVPSDGRWGILVKNGCNVGTEIYNNIILNFHAWRGCITVEDTTGFKSDYNILHNKMSNAGDGTTITLAQWQALGFDTHSQLANALGDIFKDPANSDYHLKSTSQAIDTGTALLSIYVPEDLDGTPRPLGNAFDIGCYEHVPFPSHVEVEALAIGLNANPSPGYVTINGQLTNFNLQVLNTGGQVVRNLTGLNAPVTVQLDDLPPGLHFLLVENGNNQLLSLKIIIKDQ
ncbi:MAG: hypothetical protein RI973_1819 [Bacteroidota bacterium]|jgi:parallel beta-helix repeat protein